MTASSTSGRRPTSEAFLAFEGSAGTRPVVRALDPALATFCVLTSLPHGIAVEVARTEPVLLERYGRPAAVLVSPERYEQLLDAF